MVVGVLIEKYEDGKRFVVRADEKLTAFLVLESAIRGGWPLAGAIG